MANDANGVFLIGRVTRDPEIKTAGSTSLCNFSIANNKSFVQNGEKKEKVNYFDCAVWGKQAEIFKQYVTKGKQILIQGELEQQTWDTPDGSKASKVKIRVNNFQLLGGKSQSSVDEITESAVNEIYEQNVDYSQDPDTIF